MVERNTVNILINVRFILKASHGQQPFLQHGEVYFFKNSEDR